ncbi:MAG: hypothetical protein HQM16_16715 [Deltaproteobacteria bacterium]|nr:hypothetical protein [Deltaproteobacteria bacterium]
MTKGFNRVKVKFVTCAMITIKGHTNIRWQFYQLIGNRQFPQTALFYGNGSIGKKLVAIEIVAALFCQKNKGQSPHSGDTGTQPPCGECPSCKMVFKEAHPDFFVLRPTPPNWEPDKKESVADRPQSNWSLKIKQVHALTSRLTHFPLMADYQVVMIDEAEKMTRETANSLLKLLEEPRATQIFILITSELNAILPTLRSRSSKFYFPPLNNNEIKEVIAGIIPTMPHETTLDFFMRCFNGSINSIVEALTYQIDLNMITELLDGSGGFLALSTKVQKILKTEIDLKIFLQCIRQYYRETLCKDSYHSQEETAFFDRLKEAEFQLSRSVPKEFVLENLFLSRGS